MKHRTKHTSLGFSALGTILVLAVIGTVGTIGYLLYHDQNRQYREVDGLQPPGAIAHADTRAGQIIGTVRTALQNDDDFKSKDVTNGNPDKIMGSGFDDCWSDCDDGLLEGVLYLSTTDQAPYYKPEGQRFFVHASQGSSLFLEFSYADAEDQDGFIKKSEDAVIKALTAAGLKKESGPGYSEKDVTAYSDSTAACQIHHASGKYAGLDCADKKDFASPAAWYEPFVDLYWAAAPDQAGKPTLAEFPGDVRKSRTAGYETTEIGIRVLDGSEGRSARYYRKDGGPWKYFAISLPAVECSKYDADPEAKLAYKGETCLKGRNSDPVTID